MISSISGMSGGMAAMQGARPARPSQEELFNSIDTDGDGSINATEVKTMAEQMAANRSDHMGEDAPTVEEIMSQIDTDGDGAMSFAEFEAGRPKGPPPGGGQGPPSGVSFDSSGEMDLSSLFNSSEEEDASTYESIYA